MVRTLPAPAWLPRKPPEDDYDGLNWELNSILSALPLQVNASLPADKDCSSTDVQQIVHADNDDSRQAQS